MSKFKVGDRVRQNPQSGLLKGQLVEHWDRYWSHKYGKLIDDNFVITHVIDSVEPYYIYSNKLENPGPQIDAAHLELVTETPQPSFVKVIPEQVIPARREIVAGSYTLSNLAAYRIQRVYTDGTISLDLGGGWNFGSMALREFAENLVTIASILEENAK